MSLGRREYAARKGTEKAPGTGHLLYLGVSRGNLESFKSCRGHRKGRTPRFSLGDDSAPSMVTMVTLIPPFTKSPYRECIWRFLENALSESPSHQTAPPFRLRCSDNGSSSQKTAAIFEIPVEHQVRGSERCRTTRSGIGRQQNQTLVFNRGTAPRTQGKDSMLSDIRWRSQLFR